jgi:hypothetical protein
MSGDEPQDDVVVPEAPPEIFTKCFKDHAQIFYGECTAVPVEKVDEPGRKDGIVDISDTIKYSIDYCALVILNT